jgi:hypothetical protein
MHSWARADADEPTTTIRWRCSHCGVVVDFGVVGGKSEPTSDEKTPPDEIDRYVDACGLSEEDRLRKTIEDAIPLVDAVVGEGEVDADKWVEEARAALDEKRDVK